MHPPRITIRAAGSLRHVLRALIAGNVWPEAELIVGPAGLLRQSIERGAPCDLFLSANLEHPRALAAGAPVHPFARNRIVALARPQLGLTQDNVLDVLLRDGTRLGISTPGADPGGDYAEAVFARADALRPGAGAALAGKALHLVGGAAPPDVPAGAEPLRHFLTTGTADLFLSYYTTARRLSAEFMLVELPASLAVMATYGMVVLAPPGPARDTAQRCADALLSPAGQAALVSCGFEPLAPPA
jgi:ABC-type molybdate transport system substrate-binding protein